MDQTREIAPDVHCLGPHGRTQTNVYFVRSSASWALVDAGWESDLPRIEAAAAALLGHDTAPVAIILTHDHPDHSGAARALAERWACRVFVHPAELAIARGSFAAMWRHAGPLDRYVILPAISALGRRRRDAMLERHSLAPVVEALGPDGGIPYLPDWRWVHTPGHTPGHVSFFRPDDGVLISGDALVTLEVNTLAGMARGRQGLSGPPWYTTADVASARASIRTIANLEPRVLGSGHGHPLTGPDTADRIHRLADAR
jgi:glyoxylase-like metal-dependent hydrolase (beta-lactamase superfamily II)